MQLTYRGVAYQHQPVQIKLNSPETGKYRGRSTHISPTVRVLRQALIGLQYRGVLFTKQIDCCSFQSPKDKISL